MSGHNRNKLNKLLRCWPHGTVAVHTWLAKQGIYRQLVDKYCENGWIVPVGRGAFARADDRVEWFGAVYAVQEHLGQSVHIGGKTALGLYGSAHFLPMKGGTIWLFGKTSQPLPAWLIHRDWGVKFRHAQLSLLKPETCEGVETKDAGGFEIQVSSRERAILEVLHLVPQKQSFEEARLLMEGLTTLRPELVQNLLQHCRAVKTKRLFLYLAEAASQPWFKRLNVRKVDLGSGKRVVVKGGTLDPKYQITVPQQDEREVG